MCVCPLRHSPLEKPAHLEASVFKQPPPLEPPRNSPPPSLRDPPWPVRPLLSDRPSGQNQRKDPALAPTVPGHRSPRPYNKVASSECGWGAGAGLLWCLSCDCVSLSSERECDLDKHCGVLDPERKKVCTRLLTCNVSSQCARGM